MGAVGLEMRGYAIRFGGRARLAGVAVATVALTCLPSGLAQEGECSRTGDDTESGVSLFGLPNCPCLVQDAPNGYLAAAPDLPTA